MRIERVLAVDPGKMTGLALVERRGSEVSLVCSTELAEHEVVPAVRRIMTGWDRRLPGNPPLRLVIERFTVTVETAKKASAAVYSLEMIGAVKQVCRDVGYPLEAIVFQSPYQAKEPFPNPKLKELGMWHRGGAGHALDAIRHALTYLVGSGMGAGVNSEKDL